MHLPWPEQWLSAHSLARCTTACPAGPVTFPICAASSAAAFVASLSK